MKVSLFGCGFYAERLYYKILDRNLADVIYVFDNFANGRFHDIEIRKPNPPELREYPVCVAVDNPKIYEQIKIQLNMMELKEFDDYYWKEALFKKLRLLMQTAMVRLLKMPCKEVSYLIQST